MSHALPPDTLGCDLDSTAITYNTFISDPFILAAVTLPIPHRPKNLFAKKAVLFRLERTVIYRLRLGNFPIGPFEDLI